MLSWIQAPVKWEPVDVTPILKDGKTAIPDDAIDSVRRNFVALKGPLAVSHHWTFRYKQQYLGND